MIHSIPDLFSESALRAVALPAVFLPLNCYLTAAMSRGGQGSDFGTGKNHMLSPVGSIALLDRALWLLGLYRLRYTSRRCRM